MKYDNVINISLVSGKKSLITVTEFWERWKYQRCKIILYIQAQILLCGCRNLQIWAVNKLHFHECDELLNMILVSYQLITFSVTPTICAHKLKYFQLILHFNITLQNRHYIFITHARNTVPKWTCLVFTEWQQTETTHIIKKYLFILWDNENTTQNLKLTFSM